MANGKDGTVQPTPSLWRRQPGEVPEPARQHTQPRVLILADNGLTALSAKTGQLKSLTTLDLGHNKLTSLPTHWATWTNSSDCLYPHDNNLSQLPDTLGNLTRPQLPQRRREPSHRLARNHRPDDGTDRAPGSAHPADQIA
ncbi:leucine-rich repeat domain-containing protein [Streptomyces sp. OE57]|uniref:leucine-rich repeat domain-containing protein n=1 Tax=Streptomyces lacaronensis TaxID=3379885 RepID=UPI0039B74485